MQKVEFDKTKPIVMTIGGSLVAPPSGPDLKFLKEFTIFIKSQVRKGYRFVIVIGGGKICREYQNALKGTAKVNKTELDQMGIYATHLNAELVRLIFGKTAHRDVLKDPTKLPKKWSGGVLIAGGWKPGWSTDYVASRVAKTLRTKLVFNGSNIDYVYDADPDKNKNAKPAEILSWGEYRKIISNKWNPGLSTPFDPIASKFCQKNGISVVVSNGSVKNIKKILDGKLFKGTILK